MDVLHLITYSLRQYVIERAARCCEFCLISQDDVPQQHEIDRLLARKHGGQSVAKNLALTCFPCNRYKGADITATDPDTQNIVPQFNPRVQVWSDHFALVGAKIVGRTPIGRATVALLRFNLPVRVDHRRLLIPKGRYPPTHLNLRTNTE